MPKYLFLRPDSRNWHVRFRYPDRVVERSLGTPDIKRAEILALPHIAHHKEALLAAKPPIETIWRYEYEPGGLHDGPNSERVAATETELKFYGPDGKLLRTTPNGAPSVRIGNLQHRIEIPFVDDRMIAITAEGRPALQVKTDDDKVLETYLAHRKITGYIEREARDVWMLFKTLTNNKALKNCDRDDGRKLVAHFEEQGLKSATIEKKIAWLNAAVNLAIKEGRLKFNPFASIVPRVRDKTRRLPLADADMKAIKHNLARLKKPINCWSACWRQRECDLARHSRLMARKKSAACAMLSSGERPNNQHAACLYRPPCCHSCRSPSRGRSLIGQRTKTLRTRRRNGLIGSWTTAA